MMVPLLLSLKGRQAEHSIPMERLYEYVGISRQGFYQAVKAHHQKQKMFEEIEYLVNSYRQEKDRRAGSRSLFYNLGIKDRFAIGVNKFEQMLSEHSLSLCPLRVRVVTTKSTKQSWNYPNLLNGLVVTSINKVVVGDLTYIYLYGKRYYLFCLTDVYSARIVGYHIGSRMRAEDAEVALKMWEKLRGRPDIKGCIHHTDGGSQYFSELYLDDMGKLKVRVSCAKNCLQNGYAEQRNGLIKHHFLPTIKGKNIVNLDREMKRIMHIYNQERKQEALGWLSPVEYEEKITRMSKKPVLELYEYIKE